MKKTLIQNKQSSYLKLISILLVIILAFVGLYFYSISPAEFLFKNYSVKIPRNVYPILTPDGYVEVYNTKNSREKARICKEYGQNDIENPCGYGSLVYQIFAGELKKPFQNGNQYVDQKGRTWYIKKLPPLTGSRFGMKGHEAFVQIDGSLYILQISVPDYSIKKIDLEYFYKILDSFSLQKDSTI